jgi:hypothetical protein
VGVLVVVWPVRVLVVTEDQAGRRVVAVVVTYNRLELLQRLV